MTNFDICRIRKNVNIVDRGIGPFDEFYECSYMSNAAAHNDLKFNPICTKFSQIDKNVFGNFKWIRSIRIPCVKVCTLNPNLS